MHVEAPSMAGFFVWVVWLAPTYLVFDCVPSAIAETNLGKPQELTC